LGPKIPAQRAPAAGNNLYLPGVTNVDRKTKGLNVVKRISISFILTKSLRLLTIIADELDFYSKRKGKVSE